MTLIKQWKGHDANASNSTLSSWQRWKARSCNKCVPASNDWRLLVSHASYEHMNAIAFEQFGRSFSILLLMNECDAKVNISSTFVFTFIRIKSEMSAWDGICWSFHSIPCQRSQISKPWILFVRIGSGCGSFQRIYQCVSIKGHISMMLCQSSFVACTELLTALWPPVDSRYCLKHRITNKIITVLIGLRISKEF